MRGVGLAFDVAQDRRKIALVALSMRYLHLALLYSSRVMR
jgi:hypothetical protein